MSLVIWLPLNGNINNQGLSGAIFNYVNNNGALSVNNSGKIGKCYERTASAKADTLRSSITFTFGEDISMCCWAYVSGTIGDTANGLVTNHSHADNTGVGITVKQVSTSDYRISCNTGVGNDRTYCTYYGTTNIKNAWHHLCLTYSKTKKQLKLWVDGKVEYTLSNYVNASKPDYIDIFNWSTTYYTSGDFRPTCKLNDVRVYDHCLSPKEVKEIAKGLVCHYKLGGLDGYISGRNLFKGTGTETTNNDYMTKQCVIAGTPLTAGKTYTVSLCVTPAKNVKYYGLYFSGGYTCPAQLTVSGTSKQVIKKTFTMSYYSGREPSVSAANANAQFYRFPNDGTVTTNTTVHWVKIEEGSKATNWTPAPEDYSGLYDGIEYDTSGFGNNLTFQGTIKSEPNSPRYDTAYNFNQTGYLKKDDLKLYLNQFTVSFWIKAPASITAQHFTFGTFDNWTGNGMGTWRDTGTTAYNCIMRSNTASSHGSFNQLPVSATEWTLYTYSYNGTQMITYKNGDKVATTTYGSNGYCYMPNLYIGNSVYGNRTTENDQSMMSDFRLYATALSDADIKELYNTPVSLTDTSSLLVQGEFKEV